MPTYVYLCKECEIEIEELRPMSMADDPMWCPACGSETKRGLTTAFINTSSSERNTLNAMGNSIPSASHSFGCACHPPRPTKKQK